MTSRFILPAEEEFSDAAGFYETAELGLGEDFILTLLSAIERLTENPLIGKLLADEYRSFSVGRFPYTLIYKFHDHEIVIIAVAHQSRKPDYWLSRVD